MNLSLFFFRFHKLSLVLRSQYLLYVLLRHNVLVGAEHRQVLLPGLETVVDIGANRGQFSLAVRHWAPNARVFAFEPLAEASARFKRVFDSDEKVTLHQAAIGAKAGESVIHVAASDDSSSLLPISDMQEKLFPRTGEVRREKIRVGRLADFVLPDDIIEPAMLKLDVQGYELEALRGCEDLLDSFSQVYVECSFVPLYTGQALADEVIAWLRERGFRLVGVYHLSYDKQGHAVQGDFLFSR